MQLLWKICWWLSILSMYTVISAFTKQGFFLLVYMVFECRNLKMGRGQTVLFRYLLSFFHNSPAAGSSCVPAAYMHEPPGLAPHHLCISAQGWRLPGIRDDARLRVPEGLTLCIGCLLTTAAGKNTSSTDSSQKVV